MAPSPQIKRSINVLIGVGILVASVVAAGVWIAVPEILTDRINRRLDEIPGYRAGIRHARLEPFQPGIVIDGFRLAKKEETAPAAFIAVERISLSFSRRDLIRGRAVIRLSIVEPKTMFLMRQRKPYQPRKFGLWQKHLADLPPFRLQNVTIINGSLRLRNDEDIPPLNLLFDRINATGEGMANRASLARGRKARVEGRGRMMGHAPVQLAVEAVPFGPHADFRLTGRLERFRLTELNAVLRHYTGVDLEKGTLDVEGVFSAREGGYQGNVKRVIDGIDVIGPEDGRLKFFQAVKEFLVELWVKKRTKGENRFENEYKIAGPLGYMDRDIFLACVWVSKTAFLQSLRPTLPGDVRMGSPEDAEEEWMALQAKEREKREKIEKKEARGAGEKHS